MKHIYTKKEEDRAIFILTTLTMIFLALGMFIGNAFAGDGHRQSGFNDHGLVSCRIVEQAEVEVNNATVITVVYDCLNDEMQFNRFVTVDKRFNTSQITEDIAGEAAVQVEPTAQFFATIGRLHFFQTSVTVPDESTNLADIR